MTKKCAEVKKIDQLGTGMGFSVHPDNETFQTYQGASVTMLIWIIVLAYSAYLLSMVFTRESTGCYTVPKTKYFNDQDVYSSVADGRVGFNVAFGVFDFKRREIPNLQKYFSIKVYGQAHQPKAAPKFDKTWESLDGGAIYVKDFPFAKCTDEDRKGFYPPDEN